MAAQDRMAEGVAAKEAQKTDKMIAFHTKHLQQLKEEAALDRFPVMDSCEIFSIFEIIVVLYFREAMRLSEWCVQSIFD